MNDTTDSKASNQDISQTPTERTLIHAILIDSVARRVVDVYMTPSYQEMEKIIGSSFWIPVRHNLLAGDTIFCDEGTFPVAYADFLIGDRAVTGNGIVVRVDRDCVLADCHMDVDGIAKLVRWNDAKKGA